MSTSSNPIVTRAILMPVLNSKLCHITFTNIDVQIKRVTANSRPTHLSDDGRSHHSSCMIGYSCSLPSMAPRGPSLLCWASFCPLPHATTGSQVKWVAPQLDIFLFELAATDLTYLRWLPVNYIGHTKIYCFSLIDPKGCIFGHLGPIINMKHSRLHSMLEHNWYKRTTTLWEAS